MTALEDAVADRMLKCVMPENGGVIIKVKSGEAVMVFREDGSYDTYIRDKERYTIADVTALGVGWALDDKVWHQRLVNRTERRLRQLAEEARVNGGGE